VTDIKANAQAWMDEVRKEHPTLSDYTLAVFALQRAIEQHETFKQEVSDALYDYFGEDNIGGNGVLSAFIIPKPDPLVEILGELNWKTAEIPFRAALEARGLEIREKGQ
jgi:hypothetical protein